MTLSITPGASTLSPREWLSQQTDDDGQPLAKFPARGQFSAKAKAALAEAAAAGMTFAEPVKAAKAPSEPKAPKAPKQEKTEAPTETVAERRARLMAELDALSDETPEPVVEVVPEPVKVERVARTEPLPVLYASEDGQPTDSPVGFDNCFRPGCFQTVENCKCVQGPKPPANLLTIA